MIVALACAAIATWSGGARTGEVCLEEAAARGLTVVDLGEDWTPIPFAAGADGNPPPYRATFLALAQERFAEAGSEGELAVRDRYLEQYGIPPTFGVVRGRLGDAERHACHGGVPVTAWSSERIVEESTAAARARLAAIVTLRAELEHDRKAKRLADLEALAATAPYYRRAVARLASAEARSAAIRAAQAHLACDGLVTRPLDGGYTWQTRGGVATFQRGAMLPPTGVLDAATFAALLAPSRDRDADLAGRVLRERIVAASGLVEDGSGDTEDLLGGATEAARAALGWTDPDHIERFLVDLATAHEPRVAVRLPALPAHHAAPMELAIEIDIGDSTRRPSLALHAGALVLARYPTTVGGWQHANVDGAVVRVWKPSPTGPRIWRDLFLEPRWLPPTSTPDRELVRTTNGRKVLATELLGPSYRSAFGLVAFVHLADGDWDQGIRTHGTGALASLVDGTSHGCHRLLGYHAMRLASFILAHHPAIHRGPTRTWYRRIVQGAAETFRIAIDELGDRYELVPPIPVVVGRARH